MEQLQIYKEEPDTTIAAIKQAENIWGTPFPEEYKAFLLKNNGVITYPNFPTIEIEPYTNISPIERFLSLGDIIIQKQYPMSFTLYDINKEDLKEYNLKADKMLTFAMGERGFYVLNLASNDLGQIYFCNFSGGDGIVKIYTNSFSAFIDSLGEPEGYDYDPDFKLEQLHYPSHKVFQYYLFTTPKNPSLGFNRFKEIFEILGDIQPSENGYKNIIQAYVHDRMKLDFLLEKGCNTEGLLRYTKDANTIKYLIEKEGLDINKTYRGRYPLQSYLTATSTHDAKIKYELIHQLLELGVDIDWSIQGTTPQGEPDISMIKKLELLVKEYFKYEMSDRKWWIKNGRPSGHVPFLRSTLIEQKLGLDNSKNWFSKTFRTGRNNSEL